MLFCWRSSFVVVYRVVPPDTGTDLLKHSRPIKNNKSSVFCTLCSHIKLNGQYIENFVIVQFHVLMTTTTTHSVQARPSLQLYLLISTCSILASHQHTVPRGLTIWYLYMWALIPKISTRVSSVIKRLYFYFDAQTNLR